MPVRILPAGAYQIGYTVNQRFGLAGTGTGENQDVGAFAVVSDDAALYGVIQDFDD